MSKICYYFFCQLFPKQPSVGSRSVFSNVEIVWRQTGKKKIGKLTYFLIKGPLAAIYCDCMRQADQVPKAGAAGGPGPDADPHHQRQHSPQHQGRLPLPALRPALTLVPYQVPYSA